LANQISHDTSQLTSELSGERVKVAGLVTGVRRIVTKTKSQMAVVVLEDLHGTIEAVVFPRVYERAVELWRDDAILIVEGRVDTRGDRPQLVVDRAEEWTAPPKGAGPPPPRPVAAPNGSLPAGNGAAVGASHASGPAAGHANGNAPSGNGRSPGQANGSAHPGDGRTGGHANGNGRSAYGANSPVLGSAPPGPPAGSPNVAPGRVLRVVVPRGDDDNACVRVLEHLHSLVERWPGPDEIRLVLHDRLGGQVELTGTDIHVRCTPELESQLRTLVGSDNLQVVSSSELVLSA
jgi:OB-fold nucleic acid binding domain